MLVPCGKHVYFITQYGCMQDPFKSAQHCVTLIALPNVILQKKLSCPLNLSKTILQDL